MRPQQIREEAILLAFGRVVREMREMRKWTQEKLAEAAGISRNYVGDIETGSKAASIVTIFRIAQALEVSPAIMIGRAYRQLS